MDADVEAVKDDQSRDDQNRLEALPPPEERELPPPPEERSLPPPPEERILPPVPEERSAPAIPESNLDSMDEPCGELSAAAPGATDTAPVDETSAANAVREEMVHLCDTSYKLFLHPPLS